MSTSNAIAPPAGGSEGSNLRRYLAERGVIVMKENRTVARVVATSIGAPLEVAGQILVMIRGSNREISTGVKFEQSQSDAHLGSAAFVDFDELEEFLGAFDFITTAAERMAGDRRDHTEVAYSTRDDVTVGFYQDGQKQHAFVRLGAVSRAMFFGIRALAEIREAVVAAKEHIATRRAAWEQHA